jgi:ribosome-associated protein
VLKIRNDIEIDEKQLVFKVSRSGGPGGQNVNKVNTRVTAYFDVNNCTSLSNTQKRRILSRLKTRADKAGVIRVVSQKHRTQKANKDTAVERLLHLLEQALGTRRKRKKTKVPLYAVERRLKEKKRRSQLKHQRSKSDILYE